MIANPLDIHRFHLSQMLKLTRAAFEAHDVWQAAHDCLYSPQRDESWDEVTGKVAETSGFTETVEMPSDWFNHVLKTVKPPCANDEGGRN